MRLTITFSDLYGRVSEFLSLGSSPTGTNLTKVKDIVYRGLRDFYYPVDLTTGNPHIWSFLKVFYTLNTVEGHWKYSLPVNFSEILTNLNYDPDECLASLKRRSPQQIIQYRTDSSDSNYPDYYAVTPLTFDNATGTFYELWLYPTPNNSYPLSFFYKIDPLKPENDGDYLPGSIKSEEAILESCLAKAEQQEDDVIGLHTQLAIEKVQKLISLDKVPNTAKIGNLYSSARRIHPRFKPHGSLVDTDLIYSGD